MKRILVVDDELNLVLLLQAVLGSLPGCQVEIATGAEEALQVLDKAVFDLLITDFRMPGMDGIALAARVQEEYPGTAVILITAFADEIPDRAAFSAGVGPILEKPVRINTIRSTALQALRTAHVA